MRENALAELLDLLADKVAQRVIEHLATAGQRDELLDLRQVEARFGVSAGTARAAIRRGDVSASRGPRQRLLVRESEIERWLTSRPVQPRRKQESVVDLSTWEQEAQVALRGTGS